MEPVDRDADAPSDWFKSIDHIGYEVHSAPRMTRRTAMRALELGLIRS